LRNLTRGNRTLPALRDVDDWKMGGRKARGMDGRVAYWARERARVMRCVVRADGTG
jgi:hypothetical protein